MPTIETIRRLVIQAEERGLDTLAQKLRTVGAAERDVADASGDITRATETTAKATQTLASQFENLRRRIDPTYRELQRLAKDLRTVEFAAPNIDQGTRAGVLDSLLGQTSAAKMEAKEAEEVAAAVRRLRAEIDPLGAAQAKLNAELVEYGRLAAAGAITTDELARATALAEARFNAASRSIGTFGRGAGFSALQLTNLSYQINDIISGLLMGQGVFTIMAQQGGQVVQILSTAEGGVGGALKNLSGLLGGLLTPTRLLFGGAAAGAIAAGIALHGYISDQKDLEASLYGVGRASGATVDDLNRIAETNAAAGRVSVASAREMAAEFARTGKINVDLFDDLIGIARNYAATVGKEIPDATKELAQAFADPAKGAQTLNERLGFLDDRSRRLIETLSEQGRKTEAQRALQDAMSSSLVTAEQRTTALGRAWMAVSNAASDAFNAIGRTIDRALDAQPNAGMITALEGQRTRELARPSLNPQVIAGINARYDAMIASLRKAVEEADAARAEVAAENRRIETNRLALEAGKIVDQLSPGYQQLRELTAQKLKLDEALANDNVKKAAGDLQAWKQAQERATEALNSYLSPLERQQKLEELAIREIQAKTPAQKAAIAAEREAIELAGQAGQVYTQAEKADRVSAAARLAAAQATHQLTEAERDRLLALQQRIDAARLEADLAGKTGSEVERLRLEHQLLAEAKREAAQSGIAPSQEYLDKIKETAAAVAALKQLEAERRLASDLAFERSQIGLSPIEQEVNARLRSANIDSTSQQGLLLAQQIRINEQLKITSDLGKDAFKGIVSDIRSGASAMETLSNALERLADKLVDMAIDDLWGAIFKPAVGAPGGTSIFSSLFALFGFPVAHSGWHVGMEPPPATRMVDPRMFMNAPRFHQGLAPDEFPAILQRGERVTPRGAMPTPVAMIAQRANDNAMGSGRPQTIIQSIDARNMRGEDVDRLLSGLREIGVEVAEIKRGFDGRAVNAVAADTRNPTGRIQKALGQTTHTKQRRTGAR